MTLLKWTTGDVIDEDTINKRSIRKGAEADISAIASGNREDGDHFWNSSISNFGAPQVQLDATNDKRSNIMALLGSDETEVSIASATPTQVKDLGFIKDSNAFSGNQITIVARIKQSGGGTTTLIMEVDGGPTDEITLTSTSSSYEVKIGSYDASGLADGHHTLEFYISNNTNTAYLEILEVWGL